MKFVIELPLPPKAQSSNYRGKTKDRNRQKVIRNYRALCCQHFIEAQLPRLPRAAIVRGGRVTVHLDYYLNRDPLYAEFYYYPKDEDSARAAAKTAQDALQDAGVIPSDCSQLVKAGDTNLHKTQAQHKGRDGLVMTLEMSDSLALLGLENLNNLGSDNGQTKNSNHRRAASGASKESRDRQRLKKRYAAHGHAFRKPAAILAANSSTGKPTGTSTEPDKRE